MLDRSEKKTILAGMANVKTIEILSHRRSFSHTSGIVPTYLPGHHTQVHHTTVSYLFYGSKLLFIQDSHFPHAPSISNPQMAVNIPDPVQLSPSAARRFYEVVIFLYCLTAVNFKNKNTKEPDLEIATGKSPKHEFFCFVNKLGQICDNQPGGGTITAFAVLQPGSIQYRFASNNRDTPALEIVKTYITDILSTLGQTANDQLDTVYQQILGKVVAFNRPRIEGYISGLLKQFDFCIKTCEGDDTPGGTFLPLRSYGIIFTHAVFIHPRGVQLTHI